MKLVLFAHTPPPHHGQSYMIEQLLEGFGGDQSLASAHVGPRAGGAGGAPAIPPEIACYHVNCRLSQDAEDIGRMRGGKLAALVWYCFQAWRRRFGFGARIFFCVPAAPLRSALYRDWLVMLLCRPCFKQVVFYWQAAGLGDWLRDQAAPWERWLTRRLLGRPNLSIVLGEFNRGDAEALQSRSIVVVPNGIPDPCPGFEVDSRPEREARARERVERLRRARDGADSASAGGGPLLGFRVLYLSLCLREKGLFDTIEAMAIAHRRLVSAGAPVRLRLTVAGTFWRAAERGEFDRRIRQPDLQAPAGEGDGAGGSIVGSTTPLVEYRGFVSGEEKRRLFRESDCFCFPTYYWAESFGLVLAEAMAFGLDVVTARWRNLPEMLPEGYPGLVDPRSPPQIADRMEEFLWTYRGVELRRRFEARYTAVRCLEGVRAALRSLRREDLA